MQGRCRCWVQKSAEKTTRCRHDGRCAGAAAGSTRPGRSLRHHEVVLLDLLVHLLQPWRPAGDTQEVKVKAQDQPNRSRRPRSQRATRGRRGGCLAS